MPAAGHLSRPFPCCAMAVMVARCHGESPWNRTRSKQKRGGWERDFCGGSGVCPPAFARTKNDDSQDNLPRTQP